MPDDFTPRSHPAFRLPVRKLPPGAPDDNSLNGNRARNAGWFDRGASKRRFADAALSAHSADLRRRLKDQGVDLVRQSDLLLLDPASCWAKTVPPRAEQKFFPDSFTRLSQNHVMFAAFFAQHDKELYPSATYYHLTFARPPVPYGEDFTASHKVASSALKKILAALPRSGLLPLGRACHTKENDVGIHEHIHILVRADQPLTDAQFSAVRDLSKKYGDYFRADLRTSSPGEVAWYLFHPELHDHPALQEGDRLRWVYEQTRHIRRCALLGPWLTAFQKLRKTHKVVLSKTGRCTDSGADDQTAGFDRKLELRRKDRPRPRRSKNENRNIAEHADKDVENTSNFSSVPPASSVLHAVFRDLPPRPTARALSMASFLAACLYAPDEVAGENRDFAGQNFNGGENASNFSPSEPGGGGRESAPPPPPHIRPPAENMLLVTQQPQSLFCDFTCCPLLVAGFTLTPATDEGKKRLSRLLAEFLSRRSEFEDGLWWNHGLTYNDVLTCDLNSCCKLNQIDPSQYRFQLPFKVGDNGLAIIDRRTGKTIFDLAILAGWRSAPPGDELYSLIPGHQRAWFRSIYDRIEYLRRRREEDENPSASTPPRRPGPRDLDRSEGIDPDAAVNGRSS